MGTLAESSQAVTGCRGRWAMELCQAECPDSKRRMDPKWHLPEGTGIFRSLFNPLLNS